jgi:hypothetical protein
VFAAGDPPADPPAGPAGLGEFADVPEPDREPHSILINLTKITHIMPMCACSWQPCNGNCAHPESLFEQSRPPVMGGWLVVRDGARSVDLSRLLGRFQRGVRARSMAMTGYYRVIGSRHRVLATAGRRAAR